MSIYNVKNEIDFQVIKDGAEVFYKSIDTVRCPYFGCDIVFNAKGWRHLTFKSDQQARIVADQYVRLKLLHLAPEVLKKSHTVQGIWQTKRFEEQKTSSRWERVLKEVIYYEFLAVL